VVRRLAVLLLLFATSAIAGQRLVPIPDAVVYPSSSNPRDFLRIGSTVYFLAYDWVHGQQLWRTDGTERGTVLASAVPWDLLAVRSSSWRRLVVALDDRIVFLTDDGRLWRSDGVSESTKKIGELPSWAYSLLAEGDVLLIGAGSRAYLLLWNGQGRDIYAVDSASDSMRRLGSFPALLDPLPLGVDGRLYFAGKDDVAGPQVWVSDGTPVGTHMIRRNIECPGSACNPVEARAFFRIGTAAYFVTDDGLWNAWGTKIVALDHPYPRASTGTAAYIVAGQTLWKTDGTPSGTRALLTHSSFYPLQILDDGRLVYLELQVKAYNEWVGEIRVSDGTAAGTRTAGSIPMFDYGSPFIATIGSRLFLSAGTSDTGRELWLADVDGGGVKLLKDIDPRFGTPVDFSYFPYTSAYSSNPGEGIVLGSSVIFAAAGATGREPWISDGTADGTRLLANIAADNGFGAVSGTVRDALTGAPVAEAKVRFCIPNSGPPLRCYYDIAVTDSAGRYRFDNVTTWSYIASAESRAHLTQVYDTPLTVVAGFETTGIDFSLTRGGRISGTVRRAATGEPLANADVIVTSGDTYLDFVTTDAQGNYQSRGLDTGTYLLQTNAWKVSPPAGNQVYAGRDCSPDCDRKSGTPVAVTRGVETTGIDFALGEGGTISGTVRDASNNAPLQGIRVACSGMTGPLYPFASATTDANGVYRSKLLPPDHYTICIQNDQQGYDGVCLPQVPLLANGAITVDVSLAQQQGRVTGIVRGRDVQPMPRVDVYVRDAAHTLVTGTSDDQGRYTLYGIAPGSYFLHAADDEMPVVIAAGKTVTLDLQLHSLRSTIGGRVLDGVTGQPIVKPAGGVELYDETNRRIGTASIDNGTYQLDVVSRATSLSVVANTPAYHAATYPVALPPGTHSGIDFVLQRHGSVSGAVTDALSGAPVSGAIVTFVSSSARASTTTDASGRYRFFGEGSYTASVLKSAYAGQVYRDRDCTAPCDSAGGDAIVAADGLETPNVDFHPRPLVPVGTISGRVVDDETGAPIANATIFEARTVITTHTDANGNYTIPNLTSGFDRLSASAGSPYFNQIEEPTVTAPNTTTVDFRMKKLHVTSIIPAIGTPAGGTTVTIAGANFRDGMRVTIGDKPATVTGITSSAIIAITPAAPEGVANVTVSFWPYPSVTLTQAYTYGPPPPPRRRAAR
jgi:ELWxxDGT repeat protein